MKIQTKAILYIIFAYVLAILTGWMGQIAIFSQQMKPAFIILTGVFFIAAVAVLWLAVRTSWKAGKTILKMREKEKWMESIIDCVPMPVHVTDNDMKWTFMNKAFEKTLIDNGIIKDRESAYGKDCSNARADICDTEKCGIRQLHKGVGTSYFDWGGKNCKQDTVYLLNEKGEKCGYVETVTDLTSIIRVNKYNNVQIKRLAENFEKLSEGDFNLDMTVEQEDNFTRESHKQFAAINEGLEKVKDAVRLMVDDVQNLSKSAMEGRLDARADDSAHKGAFREVISEVNGMLDTIAAPIYKAEDVLGKMAANDYAAKMPDTYKGMMNDLSVSINNVRDRLTTVESFVVDIGSGKVDMERIEGLRKIGRRSENDNLTPSMVSAGASIQELIKESDMLAAASLEGNLEVRGESEKFSGGYRQIIEGMNRTMETVQAPLEECECVLKKIADGDLTVKMEGNYQGNYNIIKSSVNDTIRSFNELLNDISTASKQVAEGSKQVSDGSEELSHGTTEQSAAVEQLTSSVTEIAAQTKQNASNALNAKEISENVKIDAGKGNEQMKLMLTSMNEINEASTNISKIIKVIDNIAFQTNILALNAAVEAARAGQAGKGFAVVAEEVRNLAARSANAANDTTELIGSSMKKVESGSRIANTTAEEFRKIVDGIEKTASLVGDIAEACNQQSTGIAQIDQGIEQVSTVMQSNTTTSEQSAAASEELTGQANLLREMVAKFRLVSTSNERPDINKKPKDIIRQTYEEAAAQKQSPKEKLKINLSAGDYGKY